MATPLFWEGFDGTLTLNQLVGFSNNDTTRLLERDSGYIDGDFILDASGRTGQCLMSQSVKSTFIYHRHTGGANVTAIYGFAWRAGNLSTSRCIAGFGGVTNFPPRLNALTSGELQLQASGNPTYQTFGLGLQAGVWYYIEWENVWNGPSNFNQSTIRLNEAEVISATQAQSSQNAPDYFALGPNSVSFNHGSGDRWDDWYYATDGFVGDVAVSTLRPNGNGATNGWLGSDGNSTDNYLHIDEQNVVDSDFVESSADGTKDLYEIQDLSLPANHAVLGVDVTTRAFSPSGKKLAIVTREPGGTEFDSADLTLSTAFKNQRTKFLTDPLGAPWSDADVDSLQVGIKQRP